MPVKLVERALVKDILNLPKADTKNNAQFDGMIQILSAEVERVTRRTFAYTVYGPPTDYDFFASYDQLIADPDPQFLCLRSFPIDPEMGFAIEWSPYDFRSTGLSITLNEQQGDFQRDNDTGIITVRTAGNVTSALPIMNAVSFSYAPRGFRVTYVGGYKISGGTYDGSGNLTATAANGDPLDENGVVQVPDDLKYFIARKVAKDWKADGIGSALTPDERLQLKPYTRKDIL